MPTKLAPGIREKRPGYFEVRVYGGLDPLTCKPRQVARTVRGTVKDANALRAQLLTEVADKGVAVRRSVSELFDAVLEHLDALGREPTTMQGYRAIATKAAERIGRIQVGKLRASDLDRYYAELLRSGNKAGTVHRAHGFIHRCLAQAVKWDWARDNVADRASPPTEPYQPRPVQTTDAVVRLIAAAEESREPELAVAFRLLASLGGRRGEVCGLRWEDLDLDAGECIIRRAVKQVTGQVIVGDAKTHQQRTLLLDEGTIAVLKAHRDVIEERAAALDAALVPEAYVLTDSPDGAEPWKPNRLSQALRRLRDRAGYTGRLHDLRHWNASQLLGGGEAPVVVAARLGHRDPSTTHRWYAHAMPRADARAATVLDGLLGSQPGKMSHPLRTVKVMEGLVVFDGDDTLWRVEHLYDEARDRAAAIVQEVGLDPVSWDEMQREIDVSNVATLGLSRLRFPHSSVAAYERLATDAGVAPDDAIRERIRVAAASVFDRKAPPMPGARRVLDELSKTYRLALLTQGDPIVQEKRIDAAGLRACFEFVSIVDRKDESSFSAVLEKLDTDPTAAWSVGNSIPSDINPALRLGMGAVWIEAHVWAHERREDVPVDGRFLACESLRDVPRAITEASVVRW